MGLKYFKINFYFFFIYIEKKTPFNLEGDVDFRPLMTTPDLLLLSSAVILQHILSVCISLHIWLFISSLILMYILLYIRNCYVMLFYFQGVGCRLRPEFSIL